MSAKATWKCMVKGCNTTYPPTEHGYKQLVGHLLGHASKGLAKEKRLYALIDEDTGNVLASKIIEAKEKGLLDPEELQKVEPPKKVEPPIPPPPAPAAETPPDEIPPEETTAEKETAKDKITTVKSAGIFSYEITLPADAYSLFNLAKAYGLEPNPEKLFDEWIWDCVRARFAKDYKKQLVLAPVEE